MTRLARLGLKTLLLTITAGLVAGWLAWLSFPHYPRVVLPGDFRGHRTALSQDCRLVACAHGKMETKRYWKGELQVWDTHEGRLVCSIPHAEAHPPASHIDYSWAFTADGGSLIVYGDGTAKSYRLPSGEPGDPAESPEFPHDNSHPSRMVADGQGNLFVLVPHQQTISLRELWSGREVSRIEGQSCWVDYPGGMIVTTAGARQFRAIPTGKLLLEFPHLDDQRGSLLLEYQVGTPDGRTQVCVIAGTTMIWRDGRQMARQLQANDRPAISPDGRLLAVSVYHLRGYRDWIATLLTDLGIRPHSSAFVIYDVTTGQQISRMPHAGQLHFSLDGQTLAVCTVNTLELYDLPLRKPWLRIVAVALACASVVFLAGQWIRQRRRKPATPAA